MTPASLQSNLKGLIKRHYDIEITPEVSVADPAHGDFSSNVAFELAGRLKHSPLEIASELAEQLRGDDIAGAAAAGAGYLNITMTTGYWLNQLKAIKAGFARSNKGKGTKVQVEFISANPTGPTTIGNARGGFIGDILANVLERLGYGVTREYYFNDAGTQIRKLVESIKDAAGLIKVEPDELQYRGDYIEELARELKPKLETASDDEAASLITSLIIERYIKPAIAKMGIEFDSWFNEKELIADGRLQSVIDRLRTQKLVFERDGAVWLDTKKLGVEREERVLIKSNGDPTYLAPDIAYHVDLFGRRGFDRTITVLGPDHIAQFPSVQAATLALHPGKVMEMAGHQMLRLVKDGREVKMSKRQGQYVTIAELIDEVTLPVARFFTIMRANDTHMDFDLDLAKEQSQKNPYYYVMYAYVRAQSILAKAKEQGIGSEPIKDLVGVEKTLVKKMLALPELVEQVATDFGVHRLAFYGQELAKLFHDFYETVPILSAKSDQGQRLCLVELLVEVMTNYWQILGIEPVEKM